MLFHSRVPYYPRTWAALTIHENVKLQGYGEEGGGHVGGGYRRIVRGTGKEIQTGKITIMTIIAMMMFIITIIMIMKI